MRFFQSIRWRLQLWHGVMLAAVLTAFGVTAWRFEQATRFQRVDQELERRVAAITDVVRRGGPMPARPPQGRAPQDRPPDSRPPQDRPPRPGDGRQPPRRAEPPDARPDAAFYYVAWGPDGRVLASSVDAPSDVPAPDRASGQRSSRLRGARREYVYFTPQGDCVLVGRDVSPELDALRRLALLLAGVGGGVFILGLAGGWWITTRALMPIGAISATAARISTGDLAQRIPTGDSGSELDGLARVLNDTFARLQASFARQARFTADASHELRTPVAVVLTQTQAALARDRSPAEYRETLEACQRAAQRMRGLTEALLTLARLEAGDAPAAREPCDLDRVAADAVDLLRPLAEHHHVSVGADLQPARCAGHAGQLGQIVANLLSNAIFYNIAGGEVNVRVARDAGSVVLSVHDTGVGIAADDLPLVFERFYRTDRARSNAEGRTGLGLAIVRAIVESHGGRIDVESPGVGQGTTFTVRLPALDAPTP